MAKIVKVKFTRIQNGNRIQNFYPDEYDDTKINVFYEDIDDLSKEYLIGIVKDEDLPIFIASKDIIELSQIEATELGSIWKPQKQVITDLDKILIILDKIHNNIELTTAEKDAINPDNPTLGVNKTQLFSDKLINTIGVVDNG